MTTTKTESEPRCRYRARASKEKNMEPARFQRFIAELGPPDDPPIDPAAYEAICSKYGFHGPPVEAPVVPEILYRFVDARTLAHLLQTKAPISGIPRKDGVSYLRDFQRMDERGRAKLLAGIDLRRTDGPVFAAFSLSPKNDPIEELEANSCAIRNVLGLTVTAAMACLKYRTDSLTEIRVPTVADAGAHPCFCPAPAGSPVGWTWNLETEEQLPLARGEGAHPAKSLAEIVHANAKASTAVDNTIILFDNDPGPLPHAYPNVVVPK